MKTSIIILTYNQFRHTILCLESIRKYTPEPYEIIVVDNGSTDLTIPYLKIQPDIKLICNEENKGFAAGCNQGWEIAEGENILFLNNDTVVTPNWLNHLLAVLYSHEDIGMVGPLTNFASGHQVIPVTYNDLLDLNGFAAEHATNHKGQKTEVRRLIGFCLLAKRTVLEEVGCFDEQYGMGNFEDDDLSLRVLHAGYQLFIANACFIHHTGHVTMKNIDQNSVQRLMNVNRQVAKEKYGSDIFDLIYKEESRLTCCVMLSTVPLEDDNKALIASLDSIREVAEEILIVGDRWNEDADLLNVYSVNYVEIELEKDPLDAWIQASKQASGEHILFLKEGEPLTDVSRRKLRGLKRGASLDLSALTLTGNQKDQNSATHEMKLFHRNSGFLDTSDPELNSQKVAIKSLDKKKQAREGCETVDSWTVHQPIFEYEDIDPRILQNSAWTGHRSFAYDLIQYFQPQVMVELGTHWGASFLSFCQGVKNGALDTTCYAVDTWEGDPHSGGYSDEVYHTVGKIADSLYPGIPHLLRTTFDEALAHFEEGSIDMLHIDGFHQYEAVKHDYDNWLLKLKENGIILFHDISIGGFGFGVWKLWSELTEKHPSLQFEHSSGLGILFPKGTNHQIEYLISEWKQLKPRYENI